MAEHFEDRDRNVSIKAEKIAIHETASLGRDIDIRLKGAFALGARSRLGDDVQIRGKSVTFGCDLFHSKGLRIGGGGRQHPHASLSVGDRCTIHNNFINVCEEVRIGDDVGLSPEVSILTHGYWLSVLRGFPAAFSGVTIGNGVIVGYRSLIMMGVAIGPEAVVGAQSVVAGNLEGGAIYAGSPARLIRKIEVPPPDRRKAMLDNIIQEYRAIAAYHGLEPRIDVRYPEVRVNDCRFDVEKLSFSGSEDAVTDDFRDYVRKWGLRFYSDRPFRSVFSW